MNSSIDEGALHPGHLSLTLVALALSVGVGCSAEFGEASVSLAEVSEANAALLEINDANDTLVEVDDAVDLSCDDPPTTRWSSTQTATTTR